MEPLDADVGFETERRRGVRVRGPRAPVRAL